MQSISIVAQSIAGLVILLALLMFLFLYSLKSKKETLKKSAKKTQEKQRQDITLPALRQIIRDKKSTTDELKNALNLVLKHHGTIHAKLGMRTHPDFDNYAEIIFNIARHKHINKDIILNFDKELQKRNPTYKKEINEALMRGLNSRGI